MKRDYEFRTRLHLPRRTYTLIRVDGKSFHAYTRGCRRPYDLDLMTDMDATALALCENIEGARLAFVQSDEISVLLTDFATPRTEAWFGGNLQKICSLSASIATAFFNHARRLRPYPEALNEARVALFDSRVWSMSLRDEVYNYFLWRQQDCSRNSVSMTAQAHFSHRALQGKSTIEMKEMLLREKGISWDDLPPGFTHGRVVERATVVRDVEFVDKRTGDTHRKEGVIRQIWRVVEPPDFSQERDWLLAHIPEPER